MTTATRTIVMTGATRGIGLEAARDILRRSPETHLVVLGRGSSAAEVLPSLRAMSPHVSTVDIDLSSQASAAAAGAILGATPAATGAYIHRQSAMRSSTESYDADRERALWDWLEQVPLTTS